MIDACAPTTDKPKEDRLERFSMLSRSDEAIPSNCTYVAKWQKKEWPSVSSTNTFNYCSRGHRPSSTWMASASSCSRLLFSLFILEFSIWSLDIMAYLSHNQRNRTLRWTISSWSAWIWDWRSSFSWMTAYSQQGATTPTSNDLLSSERTWRALFSCSISAYKWMLYNIVNKQLIPFLAELLYGLAVVLMSKLQKNKPWAVLTSHLDPPSLRDFISLHIPNDLVALCTIHQTNTKHVQLSAHRDEVESAFYQ